jgi:tetratricopeptide (TPR) repeat protein
MGSLYQEIGSSADAKLCFTRCLQLAQEMHDTRLASYATAHLAEILSEEQEEPLALRMLDQSIVLSRAMNMPYYLSEQLYQSACLNLKRRCYPEAEQQASEALNLARRIGREDLEFGARVLLIEARAARDRLARGRAIRELKELLEQQAEEGKKATVQQALTDVANRTREKKGNRLDRTRNRRTLRPQVWSARPQNSDRARKPLLRLPGPPAAAGFNLTGLDGLVAQLEQFAGAVTQPVRP